MSAPEPVLSESTAVPIRLAADPLPQRQRPDAEVGVLDVTEWFGDTSGGIRTYLLEKARFVSRRETFRQVIVVPGARDSLASDDGVRMYRLRGPRIPRQAPYRFMLSGRRIERIARHERPDLIEIGSPFIVPWLARYATRRLGLPLVFFYHSNLPRLFAPRGDRAGRVRRAVHRAAWRYMHQLDRLFALTIVTSEFSRKDLAQEGIDRVVRVPLGVDLQCFHPARREGCAEVRRRFGIPDGPVAGFVGRFAREKELGLLLDAWPDVERRTGARLVLVGAGPLEAELRAHRYAPRVTFVPFAQDRDTIANLLASFDVCVAPGSVESFGLASLEALASGTPVLCADQGGVAEQVVRSGAGRLFASGNAESLAAEATTLFGAHLAALGACGRHYAEAEHAWETVFDRLFSVYRDVIASHAS